MPTSGFPGASSTASSAGAITTPAPGGDDGYVTSTVTETSTFTVTACAVNVPNCPAGYQTSVTLIHTTSYTTVCPAATATGSITAGPVPTSTGGHNIETITKHVTTMVPCDSTSTFVPPTEISTVPYPSDVPSHSASTPISVPVSTPVGSSSPSTTPGAGFPGTSVPAVSSPSLPAGGFPSGSVTGVFPTPSGSVPVSYPAGGPSASYSAGAVTPSGPAGPASSSYSAGSASVSTPVIVPSASYPAVPGGCGGAGCPTPAPYPSVPAGPVYPGASNSTIPATFATYQPSVTTSAGYPSTPAGTPPVATAGVGKVGSSVAAVFAVMGAILAL